MICHRLPIVLVVLLGVAACTPASKADDETTYASLACRHFRNVVGDQAAGLLTVDELRTKLAEVRSDTNIATPQIQAASTAMLAAVTAGDSDALTIAVVAMDEGCRATSN